MGHSEALYSSVFECCPENWDVVPFEEAVDFREGPGILAKDFRDDGVPLLRLRNIERPYVDMDGCNFLDPEMVEAKWSHFRVEVGDLLVSTSGTLGRVSIATDDAAGSIPYTGIIRMRPAKEDIHAGFIRYFLTSPLFQQQAESSAAGSVLRHFGPSHLREMSFPVPPLREQCAIAEILGSLDEKINLNRQINHTLEAMARAIFKAWFVDLEPVKAKATGATSFRGMPQDVFDQLPARLTESDLGPAPEGWETKAVSAIADYVNGKAFTKHANGRGRMIIRIAELNSGPGGATKYSDIEADSQYTAFPDDILFAWSGSLNVYRWHLDEAIINQHIFKVIPKGWPKWYVYYRLVEAMPFFQSIASTKATTMGHIKRGHLDDAKFAEPPEWLVEAADEQMRPLYELIHCQERESLTLSSIRDALLPKLISGEIRVPEALEGADGG